MGKHPEENVAVLAALTGKRGGKARLSRRGRPTHSANPYLKQFSDDLNELARILRGRQKTAARGRGGLLFSILRRCKLVLHGHPLYGNLLDLRGPGGASARVHGRADRLRLVMFINQCIWCDRVSAERDWGYGPIGQRLATGTCPRSRGCDAAGDRLLEGPSSLVCSLWFSCVGRSPT
eukprot:5304848-Pyramimonas_sp.AAC.1